jgi:hypothetical protein
MINKNGLNNIVKNLSKSSNKQLQPPSPNQTISGRVVDIILDENHPLFLEYGGYSGLGTIIFKFINKSDSGLTNSARPLSPYSRNYPLINELVILYQVPTPTESPTYKNDFYYSTQINMWNHPHQNASPDYNLYNNPQPKNDYQTSITTGPVIQNSQNNITINLNSTTNPSQNTFIENENIHPLHPFMGDSIYEGRFGNSIRLGSTSKSKSKHKNNWSENGTNGDPILIIRNGQPIINNEGGWVPTTEDINKDLSSIYCTSFQTIPLENPKTKPESYFTPPESFSTYNKPQIIFNSDRIVLNAKKDHLLLNSANSIGLTSNVSFNVDSPETTVNSKVIKLGGKNANESLVKGDTLYLKLDILLNALINFSTIIAPTDPITGTAATNLLTQCNLIKADLKSILSKQNKTV